MPSRKRRGLSQLPLWLTFGAACLGGVSLVALSLWSFYGYRESSDTTVDAAQIVLSEAGVYQALLEAESAQRAYVLTGDEEFHTAFHTARDAAYRRFDALQPRLNSATEREAMARMRPLIDAKFTEMQGTIDLSHGGQQGPAAEIVATGNGKALTDKIIEEMRVIAAEETTRHERALDSARDRSTLSLIAVSLLGVFVLVGLFLLFRALRRRGVEEGLRHLSEEKDEFLGMVSHELRTPITVILGNARVLKQKWEALPAEARDTALTDIEDHANRMHGVVANMLRLSRPEHQAEVELEPVHVVRLVERSINRHYARYPRPAVRLDAAGAIPPALAHEEYLGQVVENLLSNAAKYGSRTEPIDVEVAAGNGEVAISVMDRGPGIERRRRDTIFEPFVRLPDTQKRSEGLGLGLPICRLLMRTLGGDVTVSDRPGGGARFTATLQVAAVPQEEAETAGQAELVAAD